MHGDWSYERNLVHVHGQGHELCGHGCCVGCLCWRYSGDYSRCSYVGDGYVECEWPVGGVVDGAGVEWWCNDFELHGDVLARVVHVYFCDNFVHGDWSYERKLVRVHGQGHELCWYGCCVGGVGYCGSGNCSGCSDVGDGYLECECAVGGVMDSTGIHWWRGDFELRGDVKPRLVCL